MGSQDRSDCLQSDVCTAYESDDEPVSLSEETDDSMDKSKARTTGAHQRLAMRKALAGTFLMVTQPLRLAIASMDDDDLTKALVGITCEAEVLVDHAMEVLTSSAVTSPSWSLPAPSQTNRALLMQFAHLRSKLQYFIACADVELDIRMDLNAGQDVHVVSTSALKAALVQMQMALEAMDFDFFDLLSGKCDLLQKCTAGHGTEVNATSGQLGVQTCPAEQAESPNGAKQLMRLRFGCCK
mmetsp:Transcript_34303/g.107179  ORF Transcript_34303/g.107179 Transcript_34303/m.107179 type:complete len:240 (+) Transcript_34303:106-825(+)